MGRTSCVQRAVLILKMVKNPSAAFGMIVLNGLEIAVFIGRDYAKKKHREVRFRRMAFLDAIPALLGFSTILLTLA